MQSDMPREIKDIIRNVQQMDLPENGIADIRIKIQGGDVMDRPMFANGGLVGNAQMGSPFASSMRLNQSATPIPGMGSSLREGNSLLNGSQQLTTPMQQQMQQMRQNPLETYKGLFGTKICWPQTTTRNAKS